MRRRHPSAFGLRLLTHWAWSAACVLGLWAGPPAEAQSPTPPQRLVNTPVPPPPPPWVQVRTTAASATAGEPRENGAKDSDWQLWVYHPRHRPIYSLAAYFQNFPRLSFNYGASVPARTIEPPRADAFGHALAPTMPGSAWPAGEGGLGVGGGAGAVSAMSGAAMGISGYGFGPSGAWAGGFNPGVPTYNTVPFSTTAATLSDPSFLVVRGLSADIVDFQAFLEKVDIPVPEVQLRVYVLEVRESQSRDSAVRLLLNLLDGRLTADAGSVPAEINRLFLGNQEVSLAISRLTADSRVRLVSSPTLRAADGSTASVTIGTDTPTLGSIVTFSGAVQQSVTYQSAGVLLNVSPLILNDSIRLMIWQELSSFAKTETGLSTTPTKLRRAFRSDVIARNGEVLLLGGLSESSRSENRQRGLFGLGSRSNEAGNSEIVVLLQVIKL